MNIMKMALSMIFLSASILLSCAQENTASEEKEVKIKVVKEVDGEKTVIDTVITGNVEENELKQLLKELDIDIDIDKHMEIHEHVFVDINEEDIDGKKKKVIIHSTGDEDLNITDFEGDSIIHWHFKDSSYVIKKKIIKTDAGDGEEKSVKFIKISDDVEHEIIVEDLDDGNFVFILKEDIETDGEVKKVEITIESDGEDITIEEIETDEGKKVVKKKKKNID